MLNIFSRRGANYLKNSLFATNRFKFSEDGEPELTAENAQKVI